MYGHVCVSPGLGAGRDSGPAGILAGRVGDRDRLSHLSGLARESGEEVLRPPLLTGLPSTVGPATSDACAPGDRTPEAGMDSEAAGVAREEGWTSPERLPGEALSFPEQPPVVESTLGVWGECPPRTPTPDESNVRPPKVVAVRPVVVLWAPTGSGPVHDQPAPGGAGACGGVGILILLGILISNGPTMWIYSVNTYPSRVSKQRKSERARRGYCFFLARLDDNTVRVQRQAGDAAGEPATVTQLEPNTQ
jgi:hypothetical protein